MNEESKAAATGNARAAAEPAVLRYGRPTSRPMTPAWLVRTLGVVPFVIVVAAVVHETVIGDPPASLADFKGYHYSVAAALLIPTLWVPWVGYEVWRGNARWTAIPVAMVWCVFLWLIGVSFLSGINASAPAPSFWQEWRSSAPW